MVTTTYSTTKVGFDLVTWNGPMGTAEEIDFLAVSEPEPNEHHSHYLLPPLFHRSDHTSLWARYFYSNNLFRPRAELPILAGWEPRPDAVHEYRAAVAADAWRFQGPGGLQALQESVLRVAATVPHTTLGSRRRLAQQELERAVAQASWQTYRMSGEQRSSFLRRERRRRRRQRKASRAARYLCKRCTL